METEIRIKETSLRLNILKRLNNAETVIRENAAWLEDESNDDPKERYFRLKQIQAFKRAEKRLRKWYIRKIKN